MDNIKISNLIVPPQYEIATIDITAEQLRDLSKNEHLKPIIDELADGWTMGMEDREKNMRIGSVDVFIDDESHLHLDFTTRFTVKRDAMFYTK